jgi:hypothetical protein
VVRRKACRGELPVSLLEKIEILVVLAASGEEESQSSAFHTLQSWPSEELQLVLSDPTAPVDVLDFVAKNLAPDRVELADALLRNPNLPAPLGEWLESTVALIAEAESSESSEGSVPVPVSGESGGSSREEAQEKPLTTLQKTQRMSVVEKVKAALLGTMEERMILVRDSNKLVSRAVMQSPKLAEHEAESYASMKDIPEDVLRLLALNRRFRKTYVVIRALVNNPRTPIDVSMQLLPRINDPDLKGLASNRNVPDVIRHSAEKMFQRKEEAAKTKIPGKH